MGQLNSWKDDKLANYDGLMSAKAKVGSNHKTGVMKWKASATGTAYFALKVGTQKTSFSYSFDNFVLKDLTAIETSIRFTALKLLGRECAFITVEGENHHILNYNKRIRWHDSIMAWFARWLQDDPTWWNTMYPEKNIK